MDSALIISVLGLTAIGFVLLLSTSYVLAFEKIGDRYFFIKRHMMYVGLGVIAFFAAQIVPPQKWRKFAFPFFMFTVVLLVLVLVSPFASYAGGAYRWLKFGPIRFQPSEIAKIALVLFLPHVMVNKGKRLQDFKSGLAAPLGFLLLTCFLVLLEPDFGSAVSIGLTGFALLYLGGCRIRHLSYLVLATLPLVFYVMVGPEYRRARLLAFLDPFSDPMGKGFQMVQSLVAMRSGGLTGKGLGDGIQKFFYLPEAHTDFAFAIIGEELGFIGVVIVIGLFITLAVRGLMIAAKASHPYLSLVAAGLTFAICMQAFTNMAVVVGLLPTKGLVLPFISFGGSSLITTFLAIGILHRISFQVRRSG